MTLRALTLSLVSGLILVLLVALAPRPSSDMLLLAWSAKAAKETPPVAVLIEVGRKDIQPTEWNVNVVAKGAKVVHREGYHFRDGDKLVDPDGWVAKTRRPIAGAKGNPAVAAKEGFMAVGVVLHLADLAPDATLTISAGKDHEAAAVPLGDVLSGTSKPIWNGAGRVRLVSTATPVAMEKTEDSFPAAAYGPDGTLWVAYISYALTEENRRVAAPNLKEQPKDFKAYYTPGFGDQLLVKSYRDGKWSAAAAVTDPHQDLVGCALAVEGDGTVWVAYSAHRDGKHELLARPIPAHAGADAAAKMGPEERLGAGDSRLLHPFVCTEQNGAVRIAAQTRKAEGSSVISSWRRASGKWEVVGKPSAAPGRSWYPALAAGPKGELATSYDCYNQGDYDIYLTTQAGAETKADVPIAATSNYEARPSMTYDPQGRLWVAYEDGPELWGKDFGALDIRGNPLYFARTVKVVCLENGKLMKPVAELPPYVPNRNSPENMNEVERTLRLSHPQIGIDGKGRVWLTHVQKFGTRTSTKIGSYWITFARLLQGDHWSDPIEIHHSDGMMDPRPILLPHPNGGLRIVHHADNRYTEPNNIDSQIYMSYLDLPGDPMEPKLAAHEAGPKNDKTVASEKAEREAVERIRAYRTEVAGKKYQLLRGEFHRHTEISFDGGPDGSIRDMFRYALDAADFDWVANTDHDNGGGREYTWWLTQKLTDAYHTADHFTPLFAYERSVSYPHGHRNCIFARRGVRTLPRLAAPNMAAAVAGINADDTKMLYRYLKEMDGICASHTSATGMGTDWRDNDPVYEPLVEIYQGDRNNYEMPDAPRAGHDPKGNVKPFALGGWKPDGFINLAFDRGYRFGFQSSSDHFSTHISFCIVLAEKHDRESILSAMKKRHCYAATDNIIMDVRSGDRTMGDEFKTAAAPKLDIHAIGTDAIKAVHVLKDSKIVATMKPDRREFQETWADPTPTEGTHYYYVRVEQANDLAWSSPMWITLGK